MPDTPTEPLIELRGIGKQFSGVTVLRDIDLTVRGGEIHSVVGENGAGKSTLMKIVAGVYGPTTGTMRVAGEEVSFTHPLHAQKHGIGIVYQELNLLPDRTVAQNIFLGREPGNSWWLSFRRMEAAAKVALDRIGIGNIISASDRLGDLSVASQQMVEIAKALSQDAQLLILDEPTAALSPAESDALFQMLRDVTSQGVGVLYVSHRLKEVFELSDRVTVLKDGSLVGTHDAAELDTDRIVTMMVGRQLADLFPERRSAGAQAGDVAIRVQRGGNARLADIDLEVRRGEVLGIAGLAGSGRTELIQALFGVEPFTTGTMHVNGEVRKVTSPRQAVAAGMGCISEDRKAEGLLLGKGINDNGLLPARAMRPRELTKRIGTVDAGVLLDKTFEHVDLRTAIKSSAVKFLSGGNQQKVVIAKWLVTNAQIILFDEPTRGIDVGARAGIHHLVRQLADDGCAVVMVSSDLPEVIGMSDRIVVMHDGRIAGELPAGSTETEIMRAAVGSGHTSDLASPHVGPHE